MHFRLDYKGMDWDKREIEKRRRRRMGLFRKSFTQYGEDGRITDSLAGHVLRHARIVPHVSEPSLNDKQMSLGADNQVASFFLRFDDNAVAHPRHVRWRNAFRRQTPQFHLTFKLHASRVWVFRKMFPDN